MNQYEKMTATPVPRLLVKLSIPTIISMLVTNIYNMADTAFVGQLGTSASAAVGIVFGFMSILQAVGFMLGQGSGSIMSRLFGQKESEEGSKVASTGFFMAVFLGIVILILGFVCMDPLVKVLGSTPTIAPYAKTYISYILLAAPFMLPSFVLNNQLRYEGKASMGMIGLLAGALLNIGGDPLLMFVFDMGIAGAGLSTALSQVISFFILLSMFLRGKTQCKLSLSRVQLRMSVIGNICGTGFPSLIRQALVSIATMLLNIQAAVYGDAAVAAMGIVARIYMFIFSFGLGIGQGFQPIAAFNYGAGKNSRVKEAFKYTCILAEITVCLMAVIVLINSGGMIRIFRDDPQVIEIGTRALRLQCIALFVMPFGMVCEMLYQSTGHKLGASFMSSLRSGILFIPILYIMVALRGLSGIQEAQPLSYFLSVIPAVFMAIHFFRKLPSDSSEQPVSEV